METQRHEEKHRCRNPKTSAFSLQGSWAKYFPKDFDLDAELRGIRKEWEQEMAEIVNDTDRDSGEKE